ncbi:MAG: phage DNA encapsidation protein [archaeon]|nr:phage DNA encapsidation protein [archaeon]
MSKQVYYNIDSITERKANFNLIWGEKSNGKSYQVKLKKGVKHFLDTGKKFVLMRRWQADISTLWIEKYFSDLDIPTLTEGKYELITVYRKELFLSNINENGKVVREKSIGYVIALSEEQHYSGGSFLDVDMIIFEEFMERGGIYLANEPARLMIFYNTVDRKRGIVQLWMVGNTISRVNPYLHDWNLQEIVRRQKQGDINDLVIHNEENDVKIAIEYCKSSGGKTMAIGNASSMIDSGAWQSDPQPKLPVSYKNYKVLYRIGFQYQAFKFIGEFLRNELDKTCVWFIKPYTRDFLKNTLVFSDYISPSKFYQRDIYNPDIKNDKLVKLLQSFRETNIFYANDLVGTDFKQVIDFSIRR